MDAETRRQPSATSQSHLKHHCFCRGDPASCDCSRRHCRLSRRRQARSIVQLPDSNCGHAAIVDGGKGAWRHRLRRLSHGNHRRRRGQRGSHLVRRHQRWIPFPRWIVGGLVDSGSRRGWPGGSRESCDWPVGVCRTRRCARPRRVQRRQAKRKSHWMNRVSEAKSVRTLLKSGIAQLRDAQVPSYTLAAELLLLHVLGRDRTWMYSHPEEEISLVNAEHYSALIRRRAAGEPTQHLTGKQEFWGLEFEVTPDVLIPRPETEHVIEVALAKALPGAILFALDISGAALEVARRNAERHGVSDRMLFFQSDLLEDLVVATPFAANVLPHPSTTAIVPCELLRNGDPQSFGVPHPTGRDSPFRFDVVVSNPPYVGRREAATLMREVREHEPEIALYGGEAGYELYADLIAQSAKYLLPRGILVLELGHDSLPAVKPLLDAPAWTGVSVTNDLAGIPRVFAAERS